MFGISLAVATTIVVACAAGAGVSDPRMVRRSTSTSTASASATVDETGFRPTGDRSLGERLMSKTRPKHQPPRARASSITGSTTSRPSSAPASPEHQPLGQVPSCDHAQLGERANRGERLSRATARASSITAAISATMAPWLGRSRSVPNVNRSGKLDYGEAVRPSRTSTARASLITAKHLHARRYQVPSINRSGKRDPRPSGRRAVLAVPSVPTARASSIPRRLG